MNPAKPSLLYCKTCCSSCSNHLLFFRKSCFEAPHKYILLPNTIAALSDFRKWDAIFACHALSEIIILIRVFIFHNPDIKAKMMYFRWLLRK